MKRFLSAVLAMLMVVMCVNLSTFTVAAAQKGEETRAIAIVFDNSGSMYIRKNMAWSRATYAMEVFASMLNKGDTLLIYPMWPFEVNGEEYTMEKPFKITDSKQSADIRSIYTPDPLGTPIESIEAAISGIKELNANKKYVIVLTDGDVFYRDGASMGKSKTKTQLDDIMQTYAGPEMSMMYLGVGKEAIMPGTAESEYFFKKHAVNSEDVLSSLTEMCNQIFGRDTLPSNHRNGKKIDFDISMSKLIVFVQGENISDLRMIGDDGKELKAVSKSSTMYPTKGNGKYTDEETDTSLQGMMVTYENVDAGTCTIEFSGKEANIEVYYEPDADLDFVFTDSEGNDVDPEALYEGDYKVSFGMKDAKTGQLISSDLLGNPNYAGEYSVNGVKTPIVEAGHNGSRDVSLKMNDTFDANLTVTYLSGYTIRKDSTDFGWPFGGIKVAARPAGFLKLDISGGQATYSLQDLTKGEPYIAKVYYEGQQLTGAELEKVELRWKPEKSNVEITQEFAEDHFKLHLSYKDPKNPEATELGKCTVDINAHYAEEGGESTQAKKALTYVVKDDAIAPKMNVIAPQNYLTLKEIEESEPIVVNVTMKGQKLTKEDFANVKLTADCGGINSKVTANPDTSSFSIKLLPTENLDEGKYTINVNAEYTDHIGRVTPLSDSATIEFGKYPMWLKWLFWILIILLLALIIWLWLRTRVLPNSIKLTDVSVSMNGTEMDALEIRTSYPNKGKDRTLKIYGTGFLGDTSFNLRLTPAKNSYRYLTSKKRKAMMVKESLRATPDIQSIDFATDSFVPNNDGKMVSTGGVDKDISFPQSEITCSGTKDIDGRKTSFTISGRIKFQ